MSVGISDVIAEALVTLFTTACQTALATTADPTYVDTIKIGRLNTSPTTTHGNHICILFNNPTPRGERFWHDEIAKMPAAMGPQNVLRGTVGLDMAEIGGGESWWRRFTIEMQAHYSHKAFTQDEAREYANTIFQRVKQALRDNTITGSDDFGETVTDIYGKARWEEKREQGEGTTWIWRMYLGLEVLTAAS